jgi:hypothetical protein
LLAEGEYFREEDFFVLLFFAVLDFFLVAIAVLLRPSDGSVREASCLVKNEWRTATLH